MLARFGLMKEGEASMADLSWPRFGEIEMLHSDM